MEYKPQVQQLQREIGMHSNSTHGEALRDSGTGFKQQSNSTSTDLSNPFAENLSSGFFEDEEDGDVSGYQYFCRSIMVFKCCRDPTGAQRL